MYRSNKLVGAVLFASLAFVVPASAIPTTGMVDGSLNSLNIPAPPHRFVATDGLILAAFTPFTHTYNFSYFPPPTATAIEFTTDNINPTDGSRVNIAPFTIDWVFNGGASLIGGPVVITGLAVYNTPLPLPFINGIYSLIVSGVTGSQGGQYSLKVETDVGPAGGNPGVPLPGAFILFGSILAGGAGFMRHRSKKLA